MLRELPENLFYPLAGGFSSSLGRSIQAQDASGFLHLGC